MVTTLPARIPVLNIHAYRSGSAAEKKAFVETFGGALEKYGFVSIEGHGIDMGLIRNVYGLLKELFALPVDQKRAYVMGKGGERGYTAFGTEHAKDSKVPDLKEFWHVGQELPSDHRLAGAYTPNVWPTELPAFKAQTMSLYRSLEEVSATMLHALADYFGLPQNTYSDMIVGGNSILRAIHYPPVVGDVPVGAIRAAAHEDINLITILCEATDGGLELLTHDGEWVAVEALSGQLVVDSGDMLSRITNGQIPSTTHRVVNPPDGGNKERYSLPFFVHPYKDCNLEILERFTSAENPAKFPPILADDFLTQRLEEIGLLKKQ
ncbi:MAG: isopenicillin N synthase family oxygenase [Candidatus Sericytochromatia bacterium]|nr:isopenicillin N synthase family oxygenase [Candidatus Sericytochromatia bacterium]